MDFCTTKERKLSYTTAQIASIIFVSLFFIWVSLATTVDALRRFHIVPNNETNLFKNIISVSAFTSGKKLFSDALMKRSASLCGIKTLVIYSIIFAHSIFYMSFLPTISENYFYILEMTDYFPLEVSFKGVIMIETFFFISGFLTFYSPKNKDRLWFQQILMLLKRIIRLTISVCCTLVIAVIVSLIADGPHSYLFIRAVNNSAENWWHYVFHLYNFSGNKFKIFIHLWFINVLAQLTIFTSPFVFLLNRWPKYGKIFLMVMIFAGLISYATIIYIRKIFMMIGYSIRINEVLNYVQDIYMMPFYSHLSTYCFGLLIGSVVGSKRKLKFRKGIIGFLWIVTSVFLGIAVFGLHGYIREEFPNENVLFLHKIFSPYAWTIGIAWVCVACVTGSGGVVHWFLSLKVFVVFDRLSLWIYLLHPIFILYTFAQLRTTSYISEINMWILFVFVMLLTVIASAIVYIFLQIPLDFLISKIFGQNCFKKPSSMNVYNLESVSTKNSAEIQHT